MNLTILTILILIKSVIKLYFNSFTFLLKNDHFNIFPSQKNDRTGKQLSHQNYLVLSAHHFPKQHQLFGYWLFPLHRNLFMAPERVTSELPPAFGRAWVNLLDSFLQLSLFTANSLLASSLQIKNLFQECVAERTAEGWKARVMVRISKISKKGRPKRKHVRVREEHEAGRKAEAAHSLTRPWRGSERHTTMRKSNGSKSGQNGGDVHSVSHHRWPVYLRSCRKHHSDHCYEHQQQHTTTATTPNAREGMGGTHTIGTKAQQNRRHVNTLDTKIFLFMWCIFFWDGIEMV